MSSLIKCQKCQTWNEDQDYCTNCNQLLNYEIQREQVREKMEIAEQKRPIGQFLRYLDTLKQSDNPVNKRKYLFLNVTWWLLIGFLTLTIGGLALGPG